MKFSLDHAFCCYKCSQQIIISFQKPKQFSIVQLFVILGNNLFSVDVAENERIKRLEMQNDFEERLSYHKVHIERLREELAIGKLVSECIML